MRESLALQKVEGSLPASDLLLALPVKSGLVAIACWHAELLWFGQFVERWSARNSSCGSAGGGRGSEF